MNSQETSADGSIFILLGHHCCGEPRNRTDVKSEGLTEPGEQHRGDTSFLLCSANLPEVDALYFCYRALTSPL